MKTVKEIVIMARTLEYAKTRALRYGADPKLTDRVECFATKGYCQYTFKVKTT